MKRIAVIAVVLGLAALLTACASQPSLKASRVKEAKADQVKKCRFLGQVYGTAAHEGFGIFEGETKAKNDALDVAATLGATHVVWVETSGGLNPKALGKAYRCRTGFSKLLFPPRKALFSRLSRPSPQEVKTWLSQVETEFKHPSPIKAAATE